MLKHAVRWGTYFLIGVLTYFLTLMRPPPAWADRIHLPDDPTVNISAGTGTFIGNSPDIDFRRIQIVMLQPEFTVFSTLERRWLSHLELYMLGSLEQTNITYKGDGSEEQDGIVRADVSSDTHAMLMGGMRLGVFHTDWLTVNVFGHYGGTLNPVQTTPNVITVRALGVKMDAMDIMSENDVQFHLNWNMLHTGATAGFPIPLPIINPDAQIIPFTTLGYVWFDSRIDIELSDSVTQQLEAFNAADKIPNETHESVDNITGSVGARFDFNRHHAIETTGSFFMDEDTTVYWLNVSYSLRFNLPW